MAAEKDGEVSARPTLADYMGAHKSLTLRLPLRVGEPAPELERRLAKALLDARNKAEKGER